MLRSEMCEHGARAPHDRCRAVSSYHFRRGTWIAERVDMITNSTLRISIGLGIAAGAALTYVYISNQRRRNRSLLARARRQANMLINGRMKQLISDSASAWIAKGREEALRQKK